MQSINACKEYWRYLNFKSIWFVVTISITDWEIFKKKPSELFILTNELKNTDKNWIRFIFKYACIYYTFFFRKKIPSLLLYSFFFLNWKSAYIYSQFEVLCGYKIYKEKICMKEGTSITFIDWRKIIWFIPYWFLKKCWIVLCL